MTTEKQTYIQRTLSRTQQGEQSVPNKQDEQELGFSDFTVIAAHTWTVIINNS